MPYHITDTTKPMTHIADLIDRIPTRYVRDVDDSSDDTNMDKLIIEARLRSGDYFVTLATECEQLAATLRLDGAPEADVLQRIATELIYLDEHYALRSRPQR